MLWGVAGHTVRRHRRKAAQVVCRKTARMRARNMSGCNGSAAIRDPGMAGWISGGCCSRTSTSSGTQGHVPPKNSAAPSETCERTSDGQSSLPPA